jgi:hypothetical protein
MGMLPRCFDPQQFVAPCGWVFPWCGAQDVGIEMLTEWRMPRLHQGMGSMRAKMPGTSSNRPSNSVRVRSSKRAMPEGKSTSTLSMSMKRVFRFMCRPSSRSRSLSSFRSSRFTPCPVFHPGSPLLNGVFLLFHDSFVLDSWAKE